jgi:hypothetical protein
MSYSYVVNGTDSVDSVSVRKALKNMVRIEVFFDIIYFLYFLKIWKIKVQIKIKI